jgi:hypothetical protein
MRLAVLNAFRIHGPGTTREMARKSGLELLTFRPRTTELLELGLVELVDGVDGEGIYRAVGESVLRQRFEERRREAMGGYQPELRLKG